MEFQNEDKRKLKEKFKEKLGEYWHDLYYKFSPKLGIEFAMKCKDITAKIDLGEVPSSILGRFRFRLHISLCKACRHYLNASTALQTAIREVIQRGENSINLESLNEKLLKKFSKSL